MHSGDDPTYSISIKQTYPRTERNVADPRR
jgi:hypothetical protein